MTTDDIIFYSVLSVEIIAVVVMAIKIINKLNK